MVSGRLSAPVLQFIRKVLEQTQSVPLLGAASTVTLDRLLAAAFPRLDPGEVLNIVGALRRGGVSCRLAGGWGVDALDGTSTRYHHDLDLVLDDYEGDIDRARAILADRGFHEGEPTGAGAWMPNGCGLVDAAGRRLELLEMDWELLSSTLGQVDTHGGPPAARRSAAATGVLAGSSVPCLSRRVQLILHSGYPPRGKDGQYIRRLQAVPEPRLDAPTSLVVPVGQVGGLLARLLRRMSPVPPHISVVSPFLPAAELWDRTLAELREVCGGFPAISYRLRDLRSFGTDVSYLAPEPPEPFVALTEAVFSRFPGWPPYEGEFDQIVPHFTVSDRKPKLVKLLAEASARQAAPIQAVAAEVWLMAPSSGRAWSLVASFPLGG